MKMVTIKLKEVEEKIKINEEEKKRIHFFIAKECVNYLKTDKSVEVKIDFINNLLYLNAEDITLCLNIKNAYKQAWYPIKQISEGEKIIYDMDTEGTPDYIYVIK